ncbi:MAG: hypothetical protein LBF60_08980 [Treponema sp.]|jgi:hypothetical protein|nr:hypothetical protein [Treponema sp.]
MKRMSFNAAWQVQKQGSGKPARGVTPPHDAMIMQTRAANGTTTRDKGFFPDGVWEYAKKFTAPGDWREKRVMLEFKPRAAGNAQALPE